MNWLKYIPEKEPVIGLNLIAAIGLGAYVALTGQYLGWTYTPEELGLMGGIALAVANLLARQLVTPLGKEPAT